MSADRNITRRTFLGVLAAAPVATERAQAWLGTPFIKSGRAHIAVVGAGAFGGWTALALLRSGLRVTLIDAWGPGHARASSGGETRVIRAVYGGNRIYSRMAARALVLWRDAELEWGRRVLHHTGALWLCEKDDAYVRDSLEPMKAEGLTVTQLASGDAAARFPQMNFADARTVFLEHDAGFLDARVSCELVRDSFVRAGGEYLQAVIAPVASNARRVTAIDVAGGSSVKADQFVFACGPWMARMFPDVIGSRIRATRQEVFFFGTPAGEVRYDPSSLPVWVHMGQRVTYGVPNHQGRGLKIADDTHGEELDPTSTQRVVSERGLAAARAILAQRFPSLASAPLVESRVCQYEVTNDGHFLVDRHPHMENVWLAGGGSGHGFKMGPALGEHVAAVVQGNRAVEPLFAYRA